MTTPKHREEVLREEVALRLAAAVASGDPRRLQAAHARLSMVAPRTRRLAALHRCLDLLGTGVHPIRGQVIEQLEHQLTVLHALCGDEIDGQPPPPPPSRTCQVEGCDRPHDARGYCRTHYTRWQRHGSADTVIGRWPDKEAPMTTEQDGGDE